MVSAALKVRSLVAEATLAVILSGGLSSSSRDSYPEDQLIGAGKNIPQTAKVTTWPFNKKTEG